MKNKKTRKEEGLKINIFITHFLKTIIGYVTVAVLEILRNTF